MKVESADAHLAVKENVGDTEVSDSNTTYDLQVLEIDKIWSNPGERRVCHQTIALLSCMNKESDTHRRKKTLTTEQIIDKLRSVFLITHTQSTSTSSIGRPGSTSWSDSSLSKARSCEGT